MNIVSPTEYGPLPRDLNVERALLGSMLIDNSFLAEIGTILTASDFSTGAHQHIFRAMQGLVLGDEPIELLTICDALADDQCVSDSGGAAYIATLVDGLHRDPPISHWSRIVKKMSVLRQIAHTGQFLVGRALEPHAKPEELAGIVQNLAAAISESPGKAPLLALAAEDLLQREIEPREMLLDPILPEQGLVMLYAYRGIGKTFFGLGIAAAVASGGAFLRWSAPRPRKVLYIDGELPASTLKDRVGLVIEALNGPVPAAGAFRLLTPDFQDRPMPDLATAAGQRLVEPLLADVDLVVVDNLSALCRTGNENEGEGWAPIQEWTLGLRRRRKTVLLIHHAGKNKTQRGTSKREDLLDTVITLKHPADYKPSEGLRSEVHFEKTRSLLSSQAKPFEVKLDVDRDGKAIWVCRDLEHVKAQQAEELFAAKMSVRDVADELGISKSTAQRLRAKWKETQCKD
jgi:hypothetical protein